MFDCVTDATISRAPLKTPHSTLLNHSPPSSASSGSSTNSAKGFSSKVSVKEDPAAFVDGVGVLLRVVSTGIGPECTTAGVMLRKDLNPTYTEQLRACSIVVEGVRLTFATTSPTSLKSEQRPIALRARKSSMRRVPML